VTLNPDLVRSRCGDIEDAAQRLDRIREMRRADFLADRDAQDIAVRRLLVAIESALSLCYHVSARQLRQVPEDLAGCFAGLRDAGLIPPELPDRLQSMARFRNLLVHMYWKVDYGRVYDLLTDGLEDLRAFSRAMTQLV
jgi:uncharacterized protein YutE (UPF0331/DUF86 family)